MITDQFFKGSSSPNRNASGFKLNAVVCALALSFATLGAQAANGRGPQPEDMDMDMTQLAPESASFDKRMGQRSARGSGSMSAFGSKFGNGPASSAGLRSLVYVNEQASEPDQIPDGQEAWSNVIDARTLRVIKRIPLDEKPHHFYKVPNQNKAYISYFAPTSAVTVVNLLTNNVVAKIPTGVGPRHMTFSEDGKVAWTADLDGNSVSLIDTKTDKTVWTTKVTNKPNYVEVSFGYAFAANLGGASLSVLDAYTGKYIKDIPTGAKPFNMAISCDKKLVMSSNAGDNTVSFVDVAKLEEVARPSIMGPVATSQYDKTVNQRLNPRISPDCKYLWVGNQAAGTFAVFDIATKTLVGEVRSAEKGGGSDIAFFINQGPAKGVVIGTNRYSPFTTVINPNPPFDVIKRIPAGKGTHYVWLNEDSTQAYVSSRVEGTFSVYDLASLTEVARKAGFKPIDQAAYISFERKVEASSVGESGDVK